MEKFPLKVYNLLYKDFGSQAEEFYGTFISSTGAMSDVSCIKSENWQYQFNEWKATDYSGYWIVRETVVRQ